MSLSPEHIFAQVTSTGAVYSQSGLGSVGDNFIPSAAFAAGQASTNARFAGAAPTPTPGLGRQ